MISVILVNYNNSEDTIECINSLMKQSFVDYKIYVIDNASKQENLLKLDNFINKCEINSKIEFFKQNKNLGFAGGNNVGIKSSLANDKIDKILLLNNDTLADENLLQIMNKYINDGYDFVTPLIVFDSNRNMVWSAGGKLNRYRGIGVNIGFKKSVKKYQKEKEINFAPFCAVMFNRRVFEKLGLLNESYFMYFEDCDFCEEMNKEHMKMIYTPKTTVYHKVSSSTGGLRSPFYLEWMTRNHKKFILRHCSKVSLLQFKLETLIKKTLYFLKGDKNSIYAIKRGQRI